MNILTAEPLNLIGRQRSDNSLECGGLAPLWSAAAWRRVVLRAFK